MIKDRNGQDLTEAEEIKKRWQEHIQELYKKRLNKLDDRNSVFIHLHQTSWSMKASGKEVKKASGKEVKEALL